MGERAWEGRRKDKVLMEKKPEKFHHVHTTHSHNLGSLDRCVEGENAKIILDNSPVSSPISYPSSSTPLQVRSLRAGEKDPLIQVLFFDPQSLIMRLSKMEAEKVPKQRKPKQADAFKTYLYARRHFGTGEIVHLYTYIHTHTSTLHLAVYCIIRSVHDIV